MEQIENIPDYVREEEKNGRKDIRNWQTVTIDGEDAKDLDDAITISKKNGVYTLGVHIADVSNYVTENSPLDKEARKRAIEMIEGIEDEALLELMYKYMKRVIDEEKEKKNG